MVQIQGRLIAFVYLRLYVMYSVDYKIAINKWDLEHSCFGLVLYYLLRIEKEKEDRLTTSTTPTAVIWKELAVG